LPQPTALRLLGTEFLVLPQREQPAFAGPANRRSVDGVQWPESTGLWQMKWTLPRVWIVHEVELLPSLPHPAAPALVAERTRDVLFPEGRARDFGHTAVVEAEPFHAEILASLPANSTPASDASGEFCRIEKYGPQQVVITANLASPGLLVLSDAWFPG